MAYRRRSSGNILGGVAIIGFATLVLGAIVAAPIIHFNTQENIRNVKIVDKERIVTSSDKGTSSKYLIFTDMEVFENTDSFLALKFNSSDVS